MQYCEKHDLVIDPEFETCPLCAMEPEEKIDYYPETGWHPGRNLPDDELEKVVAWTPLTGPTKRGLWMRLARYIHGRGWIMRSWVYCTSRFRYFMVDAHSTSSRAGDTRMINHTDFDEIATVVVDSIIDDLNDRRGLKHEWQRIELSIQDEIKQVWYDIVYDTLEDQ